MFSFSQSYRCTLKSFKLIVIEYFIFEKYIYVLIHEITNSPEQKVKKYTVGCFVTFLRVKFE